jgi:hypothetical protein
MTEAPHDHRAAAGVTDPELAGLLEEHWEATMRRWPTWASRLGDRRHDDLLPGADPEDHEARRREERSFLERARQLDPEGLDEADRLTREVFLEKVGGELAEGRAALRGVDRLAARESRHLARLASGDPAAGDVRGRRAAPRALPRVPVDRGRRDRLPAARTRRRSRGERGLRPSHPGDGGGRARQVDGGVGGRRAPRARGRGDDGSRPRGGDRDPRGLRPPGVRALRGLPPRRAAPRRTDGGGRRPGGAPGRSGGVRGLPPPSHRPLVDGGADSRDGPARSSAASRRSSGSSAGGRSGPRASPRSSRGFATIRSSASAPRRRSRRRPRGPWRRRTEPFLAGSDACRRRAAS